MIYQTIALASMFAAANAVYFSDPVQQKHMWDQFKQEYHRSYATESEESTRFGHFLTNLQVADKRNAEERANNGTAVHGITQFFDLSQAEFAARYLRSDASKRVAGVTAEVLDITEPPSKELGLIDWTGKLTTPIKNQGYCGSCWAFSATEQIESDLIRTKGKTYLLSPEQIVQCDTTSYGCDGGWTENAYNYVKKAGGIELESDYPYTSYQGTTGTCSSNAAKFMATVSSYTTLKSESAMATYVQGTGPLSVCVDASSWNSYTGGIMSKCGKSVDHCVQAVGVDVSSYWKVRNSWGTTWGEAGYIRLSYGSNTCAIANDPTYATVGTK